MSSPSALSSALDLSITETTPSQTVLQLTSVGTSDGQLFTTVIQVTTSFAPGGVIASPPGQGNRGANIGAIAGGVLGGITALFLLVLALVLRIRHRKRKYKKAQFDGNFDPARFSGGTHTFLIDDNDNDNDNDNNLDDGMGGKLDGVVTPFGYTPNPAGGSMTETGREVDEKFGMEAGMNRSVPYKTRTSVLGQRNVEGGHRSEPIPTLYAIPE
ncbi:hypothetical protein BDZ94DRAFT_1322267 [Collybia nuda]|uniref:Uncharacterized protein n=1 Tax=Collybia nuda TaxID=64659 RepID=A0A9P6CEE2_9AGAR|nr:hypothetical protein BDZ94DRAFT_1322267 [Collybia nuda]